MSAGPREPGAPDGAPAGGAFARFDTLVRGWYAVERSSRLGRGEVRSGELARRRLVLWRDAAGTAHGAAARCPHLGADLAAGRLVADQLCCPFHGWCFDGSGRCAGAPGHERPPGRQLEVYPVAERFGLLWVFSAPEVGHPLPAFPDDEPEARYRRLFLPPRQLACHPHLVVANGLDSCHFETVHGMRFSAPPRLLAPAMPAGAAPEPVTVHLEGRPRSPLWAALTGTRQRPLVARFTAWGPGIAWATVESPLRFHTLFTARPSPGEGAATRVVLFLPRGGWGRPLRALALMLALLRDDRRLLEGLDFHPGFTSADLPLARFAAQLDRLPRDPA